MRIGERVAAVALESMGLWFGSDTRAQIEDMRKERDGAYQERNMCVAMIARMAQALGGDFRARWGAGLGRHEQTDDGWDAAMMNVVFIDTPAGQMSWHIHDSELTMFAFLGPYAGKWDGHSTDEKYRRALADQGL